jgi:hypothetical protein
MRPRTIAAATAVLLLAAGIAAPAADARAPPTPICGVCDLDRTTPDGAPEELSETSWEMFAHPPTQNSWVVAEGTFASGRTTDLLRDGPVRTDRPPDTDRYPNARWRKHLSRYDERSRFPAALADYQCRRYADRDPAVTTVRVLRSNRPVAGTYDRANTRVLGAYRCGPSGATAVESDGEE